MKKDLLILVLTSNFLGAIAQLSLKTGMKIYGQINFGPDMILAALQPYVFLGLLTYFLSAISWILALSKAEVSYVYPFASISYVMVTILSWLILNENIGLLRLLGVFVIITGVYFVGKSATSKEIKQEKKSK